MKFKKVDFEWLVTGDMMGDNPSIGKGNMKKGDIILKKFEALKKKVDKKIVITIGGPSGTGKSSISGYVGTKLIRDYKESVYIMSGDNYPRKPPQINEDHRTHLHKTFGKERLREYLGSEQEINFDRIRDIVRQFKSSERFLSIRIMDNPGNKVHDDNFQIDVGNTNVLIVEGTWANRIDGDLNVFLNFKGLEEIIERRSCRGRDRKTEIDGFIWTVEMEKLGSIRDTLESTSSCLSMVVPCDV